MPTRPPGQTPSCAGVERTVQDRLQHRPYRRSVQRGEVDPAAKAVLPQRRHAFGTRLVSSHGRHDDDPGARRQQRKRRSPFVELVCVIDQHEDRGVSGYRGSSASASCRIEKRSPLPRDIDRAEQGGKRGRMAPLPNARDAREAVDGPPHALRPVADRVEESRDFADPGVAGDDGAPAREQQLVEHRDLLLTGGEGPCQRGTRSRHAAEGTAVSHGPSVARRRSLPPEVRLDESVDVAVEHAVHVADLEAAAQVLHHLVRLQHVGTDL